MTDDVKFDPGSLAFYENALPEPDDIVMVKVARLADMGAYATLVEYNNIEGLILTSELSKRRIRSITKLIRVGSYEVATVLRVDAEKGYIDLSKRRVAPDDIEVCENRYAKVKRVHQTALNISKRCKIPLSEINQKVVWPMYKSRGGPENAVTTPNIIEFVNKASLDDNVKQLLIQDFQAKLAKSPLKIRLRIDVYCRGPEGVRGLREALAAGFEASTSECPLTIRLLAPPHYVITSISLDRTAAKKVVEHASQLIEAKALTYQGGGFRRVGKIIVLGTEDDNRMEELLDEMDKGDDDDNDDEDDDNDDDDDSSDESDTDKRE